MCRKKGNKTRDWFKREEKVSKSPVNWKSFLNNYELVNTVIGNSVELILMVNENKPIKFPDYAKILRDPNVWI